MDALVKVVLVFFISLLSFSVGTFVGKQVSDSDHRRASLEGDGHSDSAHGEAHAANSHESASDVAQNEEDHAPSQDEVEDLAAEFIQDERSVASLDEQVNSAPDEEGYTSYKKDSSKHSEEEAPPVAKEEKGKANSHEKAASPDAHGKSHTPEKSHEEPKAQAKHEKPHGQPLEAAKAISQGKAPTSGKEVEKPRKPSSSLPAVASTSIGKYTVQVASYAAEDDAKKYASTLKSKGWNAFYVPAEIKGTTWYRVSVGLFDEPGSAGEFKTKFLKTSGAKDALVVKIVQ